MHKNKSFARERAQHGVDSAPEMFATAGNDEQHDHTPYVYVPRKCAPTSNVYGYPVFSEIRGLTWSANAGDS
jgi:hypothetical protein